RPGLVRVRRRAAGPALLPRRPLPSLRRRHERDPARPDRPRRAGAERLVSDTLRGVRVLDLTRMLAGPYATMLLADMGAEVIKVEDPAGDPIRRMGPPFESDGRSAYFMAVNRNKKSVVLDLRTDRDRDRFLELVRTADAVVDNFRAGVMEKLRLTPPHLRAVKPDIVTCSLTAFGGYGPY